MHNLGGIIRHWGLGVKLVITHMSCVPCSFLEIQDGVSEGG
jgi:hypothetical protein